MAGIDLGKSLQDLYKGAAEAVQGAVDTVKNAAKDVKIPEIRLDKIASVFSGKSEDGETEAVQPAAVIQNVGVRNALKVFYYMMAADGEVFHSEEDKFDSIGTELDPNYAADKPLIVGECRRSMEEADDPEEIYDVLRDGIEQAVCAPAGADEATIPSKLLVWDLLALAYSDGAYDDAERRLLKYVVRKLNIDRAVFLEMESSLLTVRDLERESEWIKQTDRPYGTVDAVVREIEKRKNDVLSSVKELIEF